MCAVELRERVVKDELVRVERKLDAEQKAAEKARKDAMYAAQAAERENNVKAMQDERLRKLMAGEKAGGEDVEAGGGRGGGFGLW